MVVLIEHAGKGGSYFADYAKTIIQAYLQSYPVATGPPGTARHMSSHEKTCLRC